MEVQLTDFENAAFAVFIVLLSRAIMSQNLNFYIPISKVRFKICSPNGLLKLIFFFAVFGSTMNAVRWTRTCTERRSATPLTRPSSSSESLSSPLRLPERPLPHPLAM